MTQNHDSLNPLKQLRGNLYNKIKIDLKNGFEDCCKVFTFIRKTNTISFNNKMNFFNIIHLVLDNEYNQTDILIHDITIPTKFGAPIVIAIVGYTRSGKSEAAQLIHFIVKQANKKYKNRDITLFLCWTQPQLKIALKKIKKGDIVWVDEQPKTTGTGSRKESWDIDNVLHAIAKKENCFIFTTPKIKNIKSDICDLYLETAGQNRKEKINRFMILDSDKRYFGHVYLKLHKDEEFRKWYEKEKDKFINNISYDGGTVRVTQDEDLDKIEEKGEVEIFINGIEYGELREILNGYDSKTPERDIDIYLRRHIKGLTLPNLGKIYNVSNPSYYISKVENYVKNYLDLKNN